ncbi:3-hydroxyisobutyrate dehydrogenase [Natronocella acetinitrilica]|uniref:3-hydroxyisobutyrate dehydrogenase n=1 Tax=Natronocella acetinitrilica TaxID=414046 RepID=A0AAE3G6Y1_9GAMM|nr:NAD(P)-dependent oxidoreductase [Natronocella acetinitrilica]MCP1676794.1 3-hydroxyisobutyrate dehydrogenase [Natronocella acetinitrilica]
MKAGLIGLGAMGVGMARNLHGADLLGAVWNRSPEVARELGAELGVDVAASPEALARAVDVVFTCVSRDEDVLAVIDQLLPALAAGKVVVDCSTIAVDTAREAAKRVQARGAAFLDAPVSGGKEGADNGQLVFMVGGDAAAFDSLAPMFDAMGKSATLMGESGAGQATKAVNQIMAAGVNQAVTEALAFGQASGLDMEQVIDVVAGGAAGNWFLQRRGKTMVEGVFEPGFKLALHHKDLSICKAMAAEQGVALPIIEMTLKHYERLMAQGHGDEDISALYRLKQAMFKDGNLRSL